MDSALAQPLRAFLRLALPFEVRLALRRMPAVAADLLRPRPERAGSAQRLTFAHVQARRATPLRRATIHYREELQAAKERNVRRAAELLDGVLVPPGGAFSWHRTIGPPLRLRGFLPGPELHGGQLTAGSGGGLCQAANLVYWLAVHAGMEIVERHRHELDLFPDDHRSAPFGCGATVFFPARDLQFRNPLALPLLLAFRVEDGHLHGEARFPQDPGFTCEVVEARHRFVRRPDGVWRENMLLVRRRLASGAVSELPLSENRARVTYPVSESEIEPA